MNNVLSLFDGISAGQQALRNLGIKVDNYYASEIDRKAIRVTQYHFPNTIQLGDVRNIDAKMLNDIKCVLGGSPCTDFTIMGRRRGMVTTENIKVTTLEEYLILKHQGFQFEGESYLFWEYVRILKESNAKYFLLENVANMDKEWIVIISNALGVQPLRINSSLITAQNRDRLYWTNIPCASVPEDKGLVLGDVIPGAETGAGRRGVVDKSKGLKPDGRKYYKGKYTYRKDKKANCLVCGTTTAKYLKDGVVYDLTPEQAEVLQTMEKGYTNIPGIKPSHRFHMLGNSWTVAVIEHLFAGLKTKKNKYELFFR